MLYITLHLTHKHMLKSKGPNYPEVNTSPYLVCTT